MEVVCFRFVSGCRFGCHDLSIVSDWLALGRVSYRGPFEHIINQVHSCFYESCVRCPCALIWS